MVILLEHFILTTLGTTQPCNTVSNHAYTIAIELKLLFCILDSWFADVDEDSGWIAITSEIEAILKVMMLVDGS